MIKAKNVELLSDAQVKQEIERHQWIESEKAGSDIGFDRAAEDWLNRFSDSWLAYHRPAKAAKAVKEPKRSAKKITKK